MLALESWDWLGGWGWLGCLPPYLPLPAYLPYLPEAGAVTTLKVRLVNIISSKV